MKNVVITFFAMLIIQALLSSCAQNPSADVDASVFESRIDSIQSQYQVIEKITGNTYLEFDGGTMICVRKNAFLDAAGNPVNSNVKVELKEVQSLDEFLEGRLSTQSNGKLLSTSGSYYINATTTEGDPLTLNKNVGLNVSFPTLSKDNDVELFTGQLTDAGDVNWIPANSKETKMPFPLLKPPKKIAKTVSKFDVEQTRILLQDIEENYVRSDEFYVHKKQPEYKMKWSAKYINDAKAWYAYNEKKLAAYAKIERRYARARRKYLKKMTDWIAKNGVEGINSTAGVKSYEYFIDQMGWYNCDKFISQQLVTFRGTVQGESPKVRVHLLSYQEMVHITNVSDDDGGFTFNFPQGIPFEVYATTSNAVFRKQFDGNNTDLKTLVLVKN